MKRTRQTNGKRRSKIKLHPGTVEARERVLRVARKRGLITNKQARIVGQWGQAWYHLNAMVRAGLLRREGFNVWRPR